MSDPQINSDGPLKGRVALVTGASRGIGEAIAARLAMEGARVVISARTAEEGESRLPGTLPRPPIACAGRAAEVLRSRPTSPWPADRERLVDEANAAFGPIDILVNNAAITYFAPVADFTEKRFKLMMEVQVWAPFHLSQLVLPADEGEGSRAGSSTSPRRAGTASRRSPTRRRGGGTVYGMCKAALERFTTGLASEVHDDGIAVNVVSPGLVDTPGVAVHGLINEATRDRVQPIEVIAEAVYRLASGDPRTMTGKVAYAAEFLEELSVKPSALIPG